ncbi:type I-B CRISPR-associated protein Cas5b [Halorubellus sp. PRR65]|uniref:type I-B CRISPR-associated protein Cas5b n=1 Tax=Halorubellus sp. PRR65 TaxID=3098148 RepID=UPI002B259CAE|nr:type I-B CRISPR-associated protein Cas5b [Halorubellus sp. PRR65]
MAEETPTVVDGVPSKCLSLTLSGEWGHFRRIDRTVSKQTYRIPPRTTLAGLLAGIVGVGRDGYYDLFQPSNSALAIELVDPVRTVPMPSLGLGTNPSETFDSAGGTGRKTVAARFPDSTDARQLHSYHYLVNPTYRLHVAIEDPAFYGTLRDRLTSGTSYYPPTLGLSELNAAVEYHGEHSVTADASDEPVSVTSVLPDGGASIIPSPGSSYSIERVPGYMSADESGRTTTGYIDYAFTEDATPMTINDDELALGTVNDRLVAFT